MKAKIDRDGCISCGLCASLCPEVFRMADDGIAEAYREDVPQEVLGQAIEAQDSCPVSVIEVSDEQDPGEAGEDEKNKNK